MYCEICHIDFPEGLRYCKWCGQALGEKRRTTSELQTCPDCSSSIQPNWTFCKSCGGRLTAPMTSVAPGCPNCGAEVQAGALNCVRCGQNVTTGVSQRLGSTPAPQPGTAVIAACAVCGDPLDLSSSYCKSCGAPTVVPQTPFGGSSLLCGVCNSHNPLGSSECRVCGSRLGSATGSSSQDAPTLKVAADSSTLPDLGEHFPDNARAVIAESIQEEPVAPDNPMNSGARTLVFTHPEAASGAEASQPEQPAPLESDTAEEARPAAGTTTLPGVAGSKTEQQPTRAIQQRRITSPVESESADRMASGGSPKGAEAGQTDVLQAESGGSTPPPVNRPEAGTREIFAVQDPAAPVSETSTVIMGAVKPPPVSTEGLATKAGPPNQEEVFWASGSTAPFGIYPPGTAPDVSPVTRTDMRGVPRPPATAERPNPFPAAAYPQSPVEAPPSSYPDSQVSYPVSTAPAAHPAEAAGGSRKVVAILSSAVVILLLATAGYVAWWYFAGGAKQAVVTPQPPPSPSPADPRPPQPPPAPPAVPEGMVMVPAGTYSIGRNEGDPFEKPAHPVELKAFFIDRTEVTNAEYKKFMDATGHPAPQASPDDPNEWKDGAFPAGRENWPVINVSWQDAADYAKWAQKRLPTEQEWEAAARGTEARVYPWGDQWQSGVANIGSRSGAIEAVGRYPAGASPAGALDMVGNVWEWTADALNLYPGSPLNAQSMGRLIPDYKPGSAYRVIRGGAYDGDRTHAASYRGFLDPAKGYPKTGFRCVRNSDR